MDIVLERMLSLIPRKADGKFVHGALKEFANSIGLKSGNLVSDWMNGRSNSYQNYVYTVAAVYGVSADWLYGRDDNQDKKEKPLTVNGEELNYSDVQLLEAIHRADPKDLKAIRVILGIE